MSSNKFLIPLMMFVLAFVSCANDQNENARISMIDKNDKVLFTVAEIDNEFQINNDVIDAYLKSDLKLPKSYSLDYVEMVYNKDIRQGAIVVQYIDPQLHQVPISFNFSMKKVDGLEVLSIDDCGNKKYKCQPETGSKCVGCCEMEIDKTSTEVTCDCDPPTNQSTCWHSPNGCEMVEIKEQQTQGN